MIVKLTQRLRVAREKRSHSQAVFAGMIGLPQSTYSRYERGFATPGLDKLIDMANKLDVSIDWLLGRTDEMEAHKLSRRLRAPVENEHPLRTILEELPPASRKPLVEAAIKEHYIQITRMRGLL